MITIAVLLTIIAFLIFVIINLYTQVVELNGRVDTYKRFIELQDYIEHFNLENGTKYLIKSFKEEVDKK